jgi:hypothetical protein
MATSVASATRVYYTPYAGNIVPIFDGTNMIATAFSEISQMTTDTAKSPAAVAASKVYDIFVWNDAGTIRATRGPAWTNSTTRGYTLTRTNGFLLNTSSITNGPAALRGTYVGTIASDASGLINFVFGGAASNGLAGIFHVWNAYNRVDVGCSVIDTAALYTYTSTAVRQAHGSATMQVSFVVGLAEDAVDVSYQDQVVTVAAAGAQVIVALGFDTVTALSATANWSSPAAASVISSPVVRKTWRPGIGAHYVAALQEGDGSHANSFNVAGAASSDGLEFRFRM